MNKEKFAFEWFVIIIADVGVICLAFVNNLLQERNLQIICLDMMDRIEPIYDQ
jgi:hypothetical protein